MGCAYGKSSEPPSGFKVLNMDCNGNVKNEGYLEITFSHLVLRFKGKKPPAVWPMSSIRKYGYEDFMFCFEAGRSSPCGQGVFAFKSKKAKEIFESVKEELSKVDNIVSMAEDISLEISQYSGQAFSSPNIIFENHGDVQFGSLKHDDPNEYVRTPDLIEPANVVFSQESSLTNTHNEKKLINAGIFASDYYQLPTEVLMYTEVEIAPIRKNDPSPITLHEPSNYKTIDFVQTMNVNQKMFKSSGDIEGRKTRHDFTLENE